ncbi:MAG: lytic murein transglycosylase, partial [Rhodomicrobium sp.]
MTRRAALSSALGALAGFALHGGAAAQSARMPFSRWVEAFRSRARARGISDAAYNRVMGSLKPDTSVYALDRDQ